MVTLVYRPDVVSTANLMSSIAHGLESAGHAVTVLTSIPHYNPPEAVPENPAMKARFPRPYTESQEGSVRVIRVFMPQKEQRVWSRLIDYLWFQFITTLLGLWKGGPCDVVFVASPPITLGLTGILLAWRRGAAFIYNLQELWPDVPVQMGLIRSRLLVRAAYALEGFVYKRAAAISTIARSFSDTLTRRGVPARKLYFTPNFVDVEQLRPGSKVNPFSLQHNMADAFVILYAGNIGLTQGLEILVEVGHAFRDDGNVQVVIVGDGAARPKLEKTVMNSGLSNVLLLPFQPADRVADMYASADVCVVPLRSGFSYFTVPSKVYTSMAAGRAVLLSGEVDSEAATLLREADAGICVPPESASALVDAIRQIRSDPELRERLGTNGRKWVADHYSRETVIAAYSQMIRDVVPDRDGLPRQST